MKYSAVTIKKLLELNIKLTREEAKTIKPMTNIYTLPNHFSGGVLLSKYDLDQFPKLNNLTLNEYNRVFLVNNVKEKVQKHKVNKKLLSYPVIGSKYGKPLDNTTAKVTKIVNGKAYVIFESKYIYAGVKMIEGKHYKGMRTPGWKRIHFKNKKNSQTVMLVEEFNAMTGNEGEINLTVFDLLRK
jgi:hypothetical protein